MFTLQKIASLFSDKTDKKVYQKITPELISYDSEPESRAIEIGGARSFVFDYEGEISNIANQIEKYRTFAAMPEVEDAIDEIVNESIVYDDIEKVITLDINDEDKKFSEKIHKRVMEEFDYLLRLLESEEKTDEDFRQWYEDGRIYYQILIPDTKSTEYGITGIEKLDPRKVLRIYNESIKEYEYIVKVQKQEFGLGTMAQEEHYIVPDDKMIMVPSGIMDPKHKYYISYLEGAMKAGNMLNMLEDSVVVYRFTRAPERRVFYVDVGKLTKTKAEEYVRGLMNKFKSRVAYDTTTGEVSQKKNIMTMLEDFWLPRVDGSRGTEVSTLQGGTQLGEITDLLYFRRKLYKALKIPSSRADTDNSPAIDFGRSTEFSREEIKFKKHTNKLKTKFSQLYFDLLRIQLVYKKVIRDSDWEELKHLLKIRWHEDLYLIETKEFEHLKQKLEVVEQMANHVGKYFSMEDVNKIALRRSDDEIKEVNDKIQKEKSDGKYETEDSGGRY